MIKSGREYVNRSGRNSHKGVCGTSNTWGRCNNVNKNYVKSPKVIKNDEYVVNRGKLSETSSNVPNGCVKNGVYIRVNCRNQFKALELLDDNITKANSDCDDNTSRMAQNCIKRSVATSKRKKRIQYSQKCGDTWASDRERLHLKHIIQSENRQFSSLEPLVVKTVNSRIKITLQDNDCLALLDTGADICTMSEKLVLQTSSLRKLPKIKSDIQGANTASSADRLRFAYMIYPKVKVGEYVFTTKFYIAYNSCDDVILGVAFFKQTRLHLDYGNEECTVTFNNGVKCVEKTIVPPHKTKLVSAISRATISKDSVILLSSRLPPRLRKYGIAQGVIKTVTGVGRAEFKIPVSNYSNKTLVIHHGELLGFMIFLDPNEKIIPANEWTVEHKQSEVFNADKLPVNIEYLSKQQARQVDKIPNFSRTDNESDKQTWPPLEHSLHDDANLSDMEHNKILELLKEFDDIFLHEGQQLSCTDMAEHTLNIPESTPPWPCRPLRMNNTRMSIFEECIKDLLHQGIIEKSNSVFLNSTVIVRKPNGCHRMCLDLRNMNKFVPPVPVNPRPIQDILGSIPSGAKYFSVCDFTSAYFQITLKKSDRKYTAFQGPSAIWQFCRTPMGCRTSGATLVSLLNSLFEDMLHQELSIFLDDLLVCTTTFELHLELLREIFSRLRKANLMLGHKKCRFVSSSASYLGHSITEKGIVPQEDKVASVKGYPVPKTTKQVKLFLGMCSFFRRFIEGFSRIASPLYELTKQDVKFKWSETCNIAFETLKEKLTTHPILIIPSENKPFHIFSDGSKTAIGYLLAQELNGKLHPIAYGSKRLDKHQSKWTTTCIETFSAVCAVQAYRFYITGNKTIVHTNHSAISYIAKQHLVDTKVFRWLHTLLEFHLEITYHKGTDNTVADALSRYGSDCQSNKSVSFQAITESWLEDRFDQLCPPLTREITGKQMMTNSTQADLLPVYITTKEIKPHPPNIRVIHADSQEKTDRNALINAQRADLFCGRLIAFLEHDVLPEHDKFARKILVEAEFFHLKNDILYRISLTNYAKNNNRHISVLCLPEKLLRPTVMHMHQQTH